MKTTIKLSSRWKSYLATLPETGMGSQRVDITLSSGKILRYVAVFNGEYFESDEMIADTQIIGIKLNVYEANKMDNWKFVFEDTIEDRKVRGEIYSEGDYRVKTTEKYDHPSEIISEPGTFGYIPPTPAGKEISIEGQTIEELKKELILCNFSSDAATAICNKFP